MKIPLLCLSLFAVVCQAKAADIPSAGSPVVFVVKESETELTLATTNYSLTLNRHRFALRLERAGEIVLTTPTNDVPDQTALTKLKTFSRTATKLLLDFETANKSFSALIEIEPCADAIRITTSGLGGTAMWPGIRYNMAAAGLWYGGGFQGWRNPQTFPLNNARTASKLFYEEGFSQGTPAWFTTKGVAIWIRTPEEFRYAINTPAANEGVLAVEMPDATSLTHDIILARNGAEAVRRIVRSIGLAKTMPPDEYFRLPIYTTWVEHKAGVSQEKVLEYARAIHTNKLPAGVIEIDDKWEALYGDMNFDRTKFPDPKAMNRELHRLGYRVTLWVHPFVNLDSETYRDARNHSWFVHDSSGRPGLCHWWNGVGTTWDFTNPKVGEKFRRRLKQLMRDYDFDGFKFDGGDAHFLPRDLFTHEQITRVQYQDIYNRETAAHFKLQETRVGVYSQPLGVVQRLIDKHSIWGNQNGLASVVPEAITVSMRGYSFLMPDMIGGNQYDNDKIDKELMIRWAQASALMPLMQFSYGPWHFDDETVRLCREASELHVKFTPYILRLAKAFMSEGEPILRPLWYNVPADTTALAITDQLMLGNDVVVAPVVVKGALSRDIYLPAGNWKELKTGKFFAGGQWLKNFSAPLDTLPVFVREGADVGL